MRRAQKVPLPLTTVLAPERVTPPAPAKTLTLTFLDLVPPGPVAVRKILYLMPAFGFGDKLYGKATTWLTVPPEQLTEPAPERSAGVAERVHEVAFETEADIVDWPKGVVTLTVDAARPVITGFSVLAPAGAPDKSPAAPRITNTALATQAVLRPKVTRSA